MLNDFHSLLVFDNFEKLLFEKMRKIFFLLFLGLALVFSTGTLLQMAKGLMHINISNVLPKEGDPFDPELIRLNNMKKMAQFVDSIAFIQGLSIDDQEGYAELVDSVVSQRFYHGLQHYDFSENYLAFLMGKFIWLDFSAKVIPNHILKKQYAFCSQSSIIFQEILKTKGFDIRTVGLPGHFCSEVMIDNEWRFHDVSLKPSFENVPRLSTQQLIEKPELLEEAYSHSFDQGFQNNLHQFFDPDKIFYGDVNAFAAPRMIWVHRITMFLSWAGWALFLSLAVVFHRLFLRKRRNEREPI